MFLTFPLFLPTKTWKNLPKYLFFQWCHPAQIQPKSQILFHKNLPPRDFSISNDFDCCLPIVSCDFQSDSLHVTWPTLLVEPIAISAIFSQITSIFVICRWHSRSTENVLLSWGFSQCTAEFDLELWEKGLMFINDVTIFQGEGSQMLRKYWWSMRECQ